MRCAKRSTAISRRTGAAGARRRALVRAAAEGLAVATQPPLEAAGRRRHARHAADGVGAAQRSANGAARASGQRSARGARRAHRQQRLVLGRRPCPPRRLDALALRHRGRAARARTGARRRAAPSPAAPSVARMARARAGGRASPRGARCSARAARAHETGEYGAVARSRAIGSRRCSSALRAGRIGMVTIHVPDAAECLATRQFAATCGASGAGREPWSTTLEDRRAPLPGERSPGSSRRRHPPVARQDLRRAQHPLERRADLSAPPACSRPR